MTELISIAQACKTFAQRGRGAMHYQTWKSLVASGEFPAPVKLGKRFYYTAEILERLRCRTLCTDAARAETQSHGQVERGREDFETVC